MVEVDFLPGDRVRPVDGKEMKGFPEGFVAIVTAVSRGYSLAEQRATQYVDLRDWNGDLRHIPSACLALVARPSVDASPRPTCKTCAHLQPDDRPEFEGCGHCRRYPPTIHLWTGEGYTGPQCDQFWPWMSAADWCGEHWEKAS